MKYKSNNSEYDINTIILDLNGTISLNGKIVIGVKERIEKLKELGFQLVLISGDQRGNASQIANDLEIKFIKANSRIEKQNAVKSLKLKKKMIAAIGNARIDIGTFDESILRIATIQAEGIHTGILNHIDIIVTSINDALDLFINSDSLAATLKE